MSISITIAVSLLIAIAPQTFAQERDTADLPPWAAVGSRYMVAADHPLASAAGARILATGGNAFDAAVAVSFAAGVVRPYSTGLGGGGFALLKDLGKAPVVIDFRERAPAACRLERYLDSNGIPIENKTVHGLWAAGVPGTLRGAAYVLEHFGTLSLPEVIQPALELAESGFPVDEHTHQAMVTLANFMREGRGYPTRFDEVYHSFLENGEPYAIGDTLLRPRLAKTLRLIALGGEETLYSADGPLHEALIEHMRLNGGPLTSADLTEYELAVREPLAGRFRNYETWTMPPPSSGGAVITAVLNAVGHFESLVEDEREAQELWPHFLIECFKHSFADRASGLGDWDPDSTGEIRRTVERMIDAANATAISRAFHPDSTHRSADYGTASIPDDHGTSHFCVVDSEGRAVAWTETINLEFGSLVMIPGTGIILNDQLDDFSVAARTANQYGLVQSEKNLIGPGKRPLSSMSPTIITRDGRPVLLAGGSGGPRIITGTLHAVLNILEFGLRADRAVAAPRFHHQWLPDVVRVEADLDDSILGSLVRRGHTVELFPTSPGIIQVIDCRRGMLFGVSDPRKGGRPAGR